MASPPDSITDIDEIALNKKRGRAASVEPTSLQEVEDENHIVKETSTVLNAPKKTKRDEEDSNNVNTIRKNMKDMSTTDKNLTESQSTSTTESQEDVETMGTIAEDDEQKTLAKFGGGGKDDEDDWGEFAEEEEDAKLTSKAEEQVADKPKYTFGASSGFGTKGWAASHQTIPTPSKQPTFGGFASTSGFGGFKTTNTSLAASQDTPKETTSVPSFGSFAKSTVSPFAALSSANTPQKQVTSPTESNTSGDGDHHTKDSDVSDSEDEQNAPETSVAFGGGAKVKVPGVKKTEVTTGEEGEKTIYQTKAKLLVLDSTTNNWKERGVGTIRINMKKESNHKLQARLVMRADSVFRVILNLLLFEGMKVFIMQDKFVRFAGFETETKEDGTSETKLVSYALKCSNATIANELCDQIIACIPTTKA